jgi:hypothetical protein
MQLLRELRKVTGNQITIDLPANFYAKQVEILIIPYQKMQSVDDKDDWKKDFLSISQWDHITEEELRIKSWKIEEF